MRTKPYYSARTGQTVGNESITLRTLIHQVDKAYSDLDSRGYFVEAFGHGCAMGGFVPGDKGHDMEAWVILELHRPSLMPIPFKLSKAAYADENDVFDVIEFLHEHCSKPGLPMAVGWCAFHFMTFEREMGQAAFRSRLDPFLRLYGPGYVLSEDGEILVKPDPGFETLLAAKLPASVPETLASRVEHAKLKFRMRGASLEDRRDALKQLADVLEPLRSQLKTVLTKQDEKDLFNLLNNFGIRHVDGAQAADYDEGIFFSWMFYYLLAAIHASTRMLERSKRNPDESP